MNSVAQATILLIYSLWWRQGGAACKFWPRSFSFLLCLLFLPLILLFLLFSELQGQLLQEAILQSFAATTSVLPKDMSWKLLSCALSCVFSLPFPQASLNLVFV